MKIIKDISHGLLELHSKHIIHLDLKAKNILVSKEFYKAIIIDYGMFPYLLKIYINILLILHLLIY